MAVNLLNLPQLQSGLPTNTSIGNDASGTLADSFRLALQGSQLQTGTKPVIPTLDKVGQQDVSNFNRFNFDQLGSMVRQANPYFDSQSAQLNKNISADLKGVLPQDVVDRYRNLAAASTVGSGQVQRDTTTLRDLGLLSLDRMDKGFNQSLQFGDYMKRQLVPEQQLMTTGLAAQQNQSQYDRNLLASSVDAAADPAKAALGKVLETYAGLLASNELTSSQGFSGIVSGTGGTTFGAPTGKYGGSRAMGSISSPNNAEGATSTFSPGSR